MRLNVGLIATFLTLGLLLVLLSTIPSPACAAIHLPKAPTNLSVTLGNAQVALTWSPPANDGGAAIDYYVVYQDGIDIAHPNVNGYTAMELTNGQQYIFSVRAHNSAGLGASSPKVVAVPRTVPNAPTGLQAIPGDSQIALTWSPPASNGGANIDYYVVYRNGVDIAHPLITSHDDTGLLNGLTYSYQVKAHNDAGIGDASETINATPNTVPGIPEDLRATSGDRSVDLTWSAPSYLGPGAVRYHLFRDGALVWSGTATSFHDAPLIKGVEYFYKVAAENSIGWGQNCTSISATPFGVPDPVWGLNAIAGNADVTLTWNAVNYSGPGGIMYHLFRDGVEVWSGSAYSHEDGGLSNGRAYSYNVAASNSIGWGDNSTSVSAIPEGQPSSPLGFTALPSNLAITLNWTAPSYAGRGVITYHLFRDGEMIWSGTSTSFVDGSLVKGQPYSYKIAAENLVGWGDNSSEIVASPFGVPNPPRSLGANAGNNLVMLNWTEPDYVGPGIIVFHLFRDGSLIWNGGNKSYLDGAVMNGIAYQYNVAASNSVGWGANSTSAWATPTPEDTVPTAPRGLTGVAGNQLVDLNWTTPAYVGPGVLTYRLFRDEIFIWSGAELSYRDTPLQKGVEFSYEVAASNSIGWGPNCTAIRIAPYGPPDAPQNLSATSQIGGVSLNWSAPDYLGPGVANYHLFRDGKVIYSGALLSWNDSGLMKGEPHFYQVSANNSAGWGPNCSAINAEAIGPPDAPRDLIAHPGDSHVDLEWREPAYSGPGLLIYHIFRNGTLVWNGTQTTFSDISLINDQEYGYNIAASNSIGCGPNCTSVHATPHQVDSTPSPPVNPRAFAGIGSITLTWGAPSFSNASAVFGYLVYSGVSSDLMLNQTLSTNLRCVLGGLEKGQTYYFKIRAQNSAGWGANSTVVSGTPYGPPGMPRGLTAGEGDARISLNWTAPSYLGPGSVTYHLFRDDDLIWNGPALKFVDSGLLNGVGYSYKVAASNSAGWGANCSAITGMPKRLMLPSSPSGLKAAEGYRSIALNWTVPSPIAPGSLTYHLFRDGLQLWSGEATFFIDSGLGDAEQHSYKVSASTEYGWGPNCTSVRATTWIELVGTVKDSNGASIRGANVELIIGSHIVNATSTDSNGDFVIHAPQGTYQVRISANGKVDMVQSISISPELFNTVGMVKLQNSSDWVPILVGVVFASIAALMLVITWRNGRH